MFDAMARKRRTQAMSKKLVGSLAPTLNWLGTHLLRHWWIMLKRFVGTCSRYLSAWGLPACFWASSLEHYVLARLSGYPRAVARSIMLLSMMPATVMYFLSALSIRKPRGRVEYAISRDGMIVPSIEKPVVEWD